MDDGARHDCNCQVHTLVATFLYLLYCITDATKTVI